MKFISWNVNGIRAALNKGFEDFVESEKPDVLCIQETKAHKDQVNLNLKGYDQLWNSAEKKGYSGTAIFTKASPDSVEYGIGVPEHDREGRVITSYFPEITLVNVYTPNAQRGLTRLDYRMNWDDDFREYLKTIEQRNPILVCGDFNVAARHSTQTPAKLRIRAGPDYRSIRKAINAS